VNVIQLLLTQKKNKKELKKYDPNDENKTI